MIPELSPPAIDRPAAGMERERLDVAFLSLLPVIRGVARAYFRDVRCGHRREDAVGEAVALAWGWYTRLAARGKDPASFPATFARLAARAVASGRRLAGQDRANDVLSPTCGRRRGFAVVGIPAAAPAAGTELADALADNTRSPVPVQAQFRADFPAWRARLGERDRFVADQLALGHGTGVVARMVGVTPARISQLRGELRRDYLSFLAGRPAG
jgi:hypothetical protein